MIVMTIPKILLESFVMQNFENKQRLEACISKTEIKFCQSSLRFRNFRLLPKVYVFLESNKSLYVDINCAHDWLLILPNRLPYTSPLVRYLNGRTKFPTS